MEAFGAANGLLPEQLWDADDLPEANMYRGGASGSAVPLVWAHSEYLRLLRSCHDRAVFDLIPEVERRYLKEKPESRFEFWMPNHPIKFARKTALCACARRKNFACAGQRIPGRHGRIPDSSRDRYRGGILRLAGIGSRAGVEFTFFWISRDSWEGHNHRVEVRHE